MLQLFPEPIFLLHGGFHLGAELLDLGSLPLDHLGPLIDVAVKQTLLLQLPNPLLVDCLLLSNSLIHGHLRKLILIL